MDKISIILDYIAETNLFNFVIFLIIIIWICCKINVSEYIEKAKQVLIETIEKSKETKNNSEKILASAEKDFSNIKEEINTIIQNSLGNADVVGEKLLKDALTTTDAIKENVNKIIANNSNILKNDLIKLATTASVEVAKSYIVKKLETDKELHNKLIEDSLKSIEEIEL